MLDSSRRASIRSNLILRAAVIDAVRQFFQKHNYLEVETPTRLPTQAPEEHIEAVRSDGWFLQTSPELCMKRLLASGYSKIFQICRCFREGERGHRHLPEMTLLEWYTADTDYRHMMAQTEALICHVAQVLDQVLDQDLGQDLNQDLGQDLDINHLLHYQKKMISWRNPWQRMTVAEAFETFGSITLDEALNTDRFDEIVTLEIEPNLGNQHPTFLMDYPAKLGALARLSPTDKHVAERFELYIGGIELCNGFSELTDPVEQRNRFEDANRQRATAKKPPYPIPEKFLGALKKMPPAAGNALGLDRLAMLFADTNQIDDVVAFIPEEL